MQRTDLEALLVAEKNFVEIKEEKWKIEAKLLTLEQELNTLKPSPPKKATDKLSFDDKIKELETKIQTLEKQSNPQVKTMREQLEGYKEDHQMKVIAFNDVLAQQNKVYLHIHEDGKAISVLRQEVSTKEDEKKSIAIVSELGVPITLKMILTILNEILHINEKKVIEVFEQATGKNLITEYINAQYFKSNPQDVTFDMACAKLFGISMDSIVSDIKAYTEKTSKAMTEENTHKRVQALVEGFWGKVEAKFSEEALPEALKEALKKVKEEICRLFATHIYLLISLETFKFTDDLQMGLAKTQFKFAAMGVNELVNPFLVISQCVRFIHVYTEIEKLLEEMAIWLSGLYEHSRRQIPPFLKDSNGELMPQASAYLTDNDDAQFFYYKPPLTKTKMATYHKDHFESLMTKLPQLASRFAVQPALELEIKDEVRKEEKPADKNELLIAAIQEKISSPSVTTLGLYAKRPEAQEKPPFTSSLLENLQKYNDEVKFSMLKTDLESYALNDMQKAAIQNHKINIIGKLKAYTDAYFTTNGLPNLGVSFLQRSFSKEMKDARDEIEASSDPAFYVRRLCELQVAVQKGKDSLDYVTALLQNLFQILEIASKQSLENKLG